MTASWPSSLPEYVLEQGYSESEPDQLLQTAVEAGRPKSRRRYTTASRIFTCAVAMTEAQRLIFEDWFDNDLRGGSLPFSWVHPLHRTSMTFQFRKPVPKWSVRGSANIVSFGMESVAAAATPNGTIPALFAALGLNGAYYDVSDLTSMFQDSAGTTAAAVNSPVGLILDKSGLANHASQATAAARPTLRQDGDSRYYLEADGVDDTLVGPSVGITNPAFLSAALEVTSDGGVTTIFTTFGWKSGSTNRHDLGLRSQAGTRVMACSSRFNSGTSLIPTVTTLIGAEPVYLEGDLDSLGNTIYGSQIDGRMAGSSALGSVTGTSASIPLAIFGDAAAGFTRSFYGGVAAFGAALSAENKQDIRQIIAALIGVSE